MNRKDRIVYKELNESSAVRLPSVQKSQGESQGEQNRDSRIFLCIKFPLYVITSHVASSCKDEHVRSLKHPYSY